jgi:hypothetical protein
MSQTASTPPTALFSGGKASADSLSARREVDIRSGRAEVWEERDLSFAVEAKGFLPGEGRGSRIGVSVPRALGAHAMGVYTVRCRAVYTAVFFKKKRSECCSHEQQPKRLN